MFFEFFFTHFTIFHFILQKNTIKAFILGISTSELKKIIFVSNELHFIHFPKFYTII